MEDGTRYIELKIDLGDDPDLLDLASLFTAIGNHFQDYVHRRHPELAGRAYLSVKRIGQSCILVELLPIVLPLIQHMDYFLIVDGFVRRFGEVVTSLRQGKRRADASKSEVKAVLDAATAISRNKGNKATISSVEYHETGTEKHLSVEFDSNTAKEVRDAAQAQLLTIDAQAHELREHVLMRFEQSSIKNRRVGSKKTGERVIIDSIDRRAVGIIYATDSAQERIKHEKVRYGPSLYKKFFDVDVYIERMSDGRPAAYRVFGVHDVIDQPDDDE